MDETSDKIIYMEAYEQKEKLIELMKNGKLNADFYLKTLQKNIKSNTNEDIQIIM